MIQEKNLVEFYEDVRSKKGDNTTQLMTAMREMAATNNIPMEMGWESVRFGSMLRASVDECLCIWHPEHIKDYYSMIIHVDKGMIKVYRYGHSKQMDKQMEKQQIKKSGGTLVKGFLTGHEPGDGVAGNIVGASIMMKGTAGMLFHAVKSIGANKNKLQEEETWYDSVYNILCSVV